jgi:hypothetical protein
VWIYAVHDEYYLKFGRVPNFADFALLPDLYMTLSPVRKLLMTAVIALQGPKAREFLPARTP